MIADLKKWTIKERGFSEDRITSNGNKFLCGNGYLGIRGTLEEFNKELQTLNKTESDGLHE